MPAGRIGKICQNVWKDNLTQVPLALSADPFTDSQTEVSILLPSFRQTLFEWKNGYDLALNKRKKSLPEGEFFQRTTLGNNGSYPVCKHIFFSISMVVNMVGFARYKRDFFVIHGFLTDFFAGIYKPFRSFRLLKANGTILIGKVFKITSSPSLSLFQLYPGLSILQNKYLLVTPSRRYSCFRFADLAGI